MRGAIGDYQGEEEMSKKFDRVPKVGEVFFKNGMMKGRQVTNMRRVIGVEQGWVCYSDGSNKNSSCTVTAFQEWMATANEIERDPV